MAKKMITINFLDTLVMRLSGKLERIAIEGIIPCSASREGGRSSPSLTIKKYRKMVNGEQCPRR